MTFRCGSVSLRGSWSGVFTQVARRYAWLAPLACSCVFYSPQAMALGFTGNFEPSFWTFSVQGVSESADCVDLATTRGCVDTFGAASGDVSVVRVTSEGAGDKYATWLWERPDGDLTGYYLSFNYDVVNDGGTGDVYGQYFVGGVASSELRGSDTVSSVYVAPNQDFSFKITISNTISGSFNISSFDAVPAPLPAAGAATAFGYSRRLRRRIKGQRRKGSCPPVMPSHPSLYLNLSPAAVGSLPMSFSYALRPAVDGSRSRVA